MPPVTLPRVEPARPSRRRRLCARRRARAWAKRAPRLRSRARAAPSHRAAGRSTVAERRGRTTSRAPNPASRPCVRGASAGFVAAAHFFVVTTTRAGTATRHHAHRPPRTRRSNRSPPPSRAPRRASTFPSAFAPEDQRAAAPHDAARMDEHVRRGVRGDVKREIALERIAQSLVRSRRGSATSRRRRAHSHVAPSSRDSDAKDRVAHAARPAATRRDRSRGEAHRRARRGTPRRSSRS